MQHTMRNHYYARDVYRTFRASRPLCRTPTKPSSQTSPQKGLPTMIKLNAGISRKIGEPNYGSRGATVNVELELESSAASDPQLLHDRIRKLFALARDAVNAELGLAHEKPLPGNGTPRPATEAQLRAIRSICEELSANPENESQSRIGKPLDQLTLPEASKLIDQLKEISNGQ